MKFHSLARSARRSLATAALAAPFILNAQTDVQLDPHVTTATRTPASPQTLGTNVDFISASDLARRQITSLKDAIGSSGAPLFSSGAPGATTSLFLRGTNSNQTLFLVDGIRFNDPNTEYFVTLGGACVSGCDNLEISHGPQSTLYGGEAIGGVISLRAQPGAGAASGKLSAEVGSFGTVQGSATAQGERGAWAYNVAVQGGHTDNDRPNNDFDSANTVLRLDRKLNDTLKTGGTFRWFHGVYGSPGSRFTNDPDNEEREDNLLGTLFAEFKPSAELDSRLTLGGQDRRYVSENPAPSGTRQITVVKNRRGVVDWQGTYRALDRHRITAGLNAEANHTRNTGFGNINRRQTLLAFFAQDEFAPTDSVFLTGGVRSDDFDTFGRATTGRATAAWLVVPKTLKLRASYGTAFRSPSFLDLYGQSSFYRGNPALKPEKAQGWDAGIDYYFAQKRGSLSVTWFENKFRDLIVFDFASFPSTTANVERARTRGLEVAAQATLPWAIEARLAYTYLEADNLTQNVRLLRRPQQSGSADVWHDFGSGFSGGLGLRVVAQREDIHASTFAVIDGEDFTVARLYAAWQATNRFTLKVRLENLLNEKYEEVHGYPQLGFGAFMGVEWKF